MTFSLPEDIEQHWLWDDPVKFQWWLRLLREAGDGDSERTVRGVVCKYGFGEVVTTQGELAKMWKTSTEKAQAFLRKLESRGEIRRKTDAKLTRITICNVAYYDVFGRNTDAKLTHRRNFDAILTQLNAILSTVSDEDKRKIDAKLTQLENFKRKEPKENIYIQETTSPIGDVQEDKSSCFLSRASEESAEGSEEPKKAEKPKKGKVKKFQTLVAKARGVFEEHYQETFEAPYYWTAKDGMHMKQLMQKISYSRTNRERPLPVDDESLLSALKVFLETINKAWLMDNFSVSNINSQYNSIVSEIKNKSKSLTVNGTINSPQTTQGGAGTGAGLADSYRQRYSIQQDIAEADRRYLERRGAVSDVSYEELPAVSSE